MLILSSKNQKSLHLENYMPSTSKLLCTNIIMATYQKFLNRSLFLIDSCINTKRNLSTTSILPQVEPTNFRHLLECLVLVHLIILEILQTLPYTFQHIKYYSNQPSWILELNFQMSQLNTIFNIFPHFIPIPTVFGHFCSFLSVELCISRC